MGSNCCKGEAAGRPIRSSSSIYSRSRAGASLDERFTSTDDAGGVRLTVSSARTGDTDVYTLQASNAAGTDSARIRLEVSSDEAPTGEDPPTFLRRLQDLAVKVGTRTRFLVEITSSTECKVTWYRNERRLLEAERVSLARDGNFWCADVAAVSVDDAGRWTCTAENAGGRASCSAHLNVLVPKAYKRPEFVEELRALLTEQGTVSLECKVVGVPTPVLRWFKDSREIKAGDVFALTANTEDPTSLGTYTCEAVNCMGRAYSSSKVHVVGRGSREGSSRPSSSLAPEPPPIFTKELEDQYVKITEALTLGCQIVVPPWPRSVVWYNKEGKIEPGDRYHVLEDGAGGYLLEIPSAEWPDEGEWKCVACSSGGRLGISTCYITMDVPKNYRKPRFMENLQAVLTEEGLVSFECKVVGFPTPVLSWFKDGQELKPGDVYQLTGTNSLGSYCCIAKNCMGQASSSAELTIEDIQNQLNEEEKHQLFQAKNQAPKFIQGLKSVEAKINEPFRFTIKVAIPPEPSVLWYRDDQPVDESSRCHHGKEDRGGFYIDIQTLELLDQAEWKCVAMNDFGHSVTSCFLKLIIPKHYKKPRFLENLQAILSDEGAVNLECKVIGVPQPVLKWYKDGEELKPGDIHRIISGQDGTCCLGTYTCEAQNCMGIAASSASLLGFDDSMKAKKKKVEEQALQRNLSLSTIHEERTSQMYDTPVGDITLNDDKGEISFSFDGKEVSVSLYETPDLTEEEALQIVEMYADQLSENITEHNVVELPPLRFVKETSTSGNLLMEAVIIDVSPEYFQSPDEDLRTEADVEDISIADENAASLISLDQDDIGGEDYLEKTMALLSEDKSDMPIKFNRKKSDSQRSGDDYFSLSQDLSLSEEKRDDTQPISESDIPSFASAHSSSKPKTKPSKPSGDDGHDSSEPTKTILHKDEGTKQIMEAEPSSAMRTKRERRTSRGSRRSSSSSEKSSKSREEALRKVEYVRMEAPKKPKISKEEYNEIIVSIGAILSKVLNDVQIIEKDIIFKSELMSSAATASRSLEIINSLIGPLSEIHSITDAIKESVVESKEVACALFNNLPRPLKSLQQSLTIIEKCIGMEGDNKTLVKKTCVNFIETCGNNMQQWISELNDIIAKDYVPIDDKVITEIESLSVDMGAVIKFSAETIIAKNFINEASDIKLEEPSIDVKHLRDTQKALFELKIPLNSLLRIAESADSGKIVDVIKVASSEVLLNDMYGSIQELQSALEQIECLSVKEASSTLQKYNTEIIVNVMQPVLQLRNSFEELSAEVRGDDITLLKQAISSIKENLNEISFQIASVENNVGKFDVLASDNKLDALQKMAQVLIALENNIPLIEQMPEVQINMTAFHKYVTKVLENVIESNESQKYFALMDICDDINRMNTSIKKIDIDYVMPLASLINTLSIIQEQFVKTVFDSQLNCTILSHITDSLVCMQKALNNAEELSSHVDSEHIQELIPGVFNEAKADLFMEHIEQTIAAIESIRTIELTQDLKDNITPIFEKISPVLEDLKRNVAAIIADGVSEEHISELSVAPSCTETLGIPLHELNENIIILNQQIIENIDIMKDRSDFIVAVAEHFKELHIALEILQQNVVSQYGERMSQHEVSLKIASVVQNLQSCIILVQEQAGIEEADGISTLEDISGIKTMADSIPSDHLVLPIAEETKIEQSVSQFDNEIYATTTAKALQTLNEHITTMQTPDIIDALDTLSEITDYSSLKSVAVELGDLYTGLEQIFHPILMEQSKDVLNLINPAKLTAIAEPMQELQQSLSVIDIHNIPIYENILEMPTEKLHSVIQSVSEFKENLDKCMLAVCQATKTTDNTFAIADKIGALREVCEHLKDVVEINKKTEGFSMPDEVNALQISIDNLLKATDVSQGIDINQVKVVTEDLHEIVVKVQEEMIQMIPQASEKLAQEAQLIQSIDDLQNNIAVLEQYDFVDLSRVSDITYASSKVAIELDSDSLALVSAITDQAVNILKDSNEDRPLVDLMIVEDFLGTCKNEFIVMCHLVSRACTHKNVIRLLQEFKCLQNTINDFKTKRLELNLSNDVHNHLTSFFINAEDCLQNIQNGLLKSVDSQVELLVTTPLRKLETSVAVFNEASTPKQSVVLSEVVNKFMEVVKTIKPTVHNLHNEILAEVKNEVHTIEDWIDVKKFEDFKILVDQIKIQTEDILSKDIINNISGCLLKHHDYKDATGTGKTLILIKCLSECSDILQESLLESKIITQQTEKATLNTVLTEILKPLHALSNQIVDIQEQVLNEIDSDTSVVRSTTETLVQALIENHEKIKETIELQPDIGMAEISLVMAVDKEIHSIQDNLKSLENVEAMQMVKEITKPVDEIEKSLHDILSSNKTNEGMLPTEKAKEIVHNIDQYIELIEIVEEVSAIIRIENIKDTMSIAKELRESIASSNFSCGEHTEQEKLCEIREEQSRLAQKLQTAISALQIQVLESEQELASVLSTELLQRIVQVTAQLQADLVAVTSIRIALQAPAEYVDENIQKVVLQEEQNVNIVASDIAVSSTEVTILESEGDVKQVVAPEQLIATTETLEKMIVESMEVVSVENVQSIPLDTVEEVYDKKTSAATESAEIVVIDEACDLSKKEVQGEKAVLREINTDEKRAIKTSDELPNSNLIHTSQVIKDTPKSNIDALIQHIELYISEDANEIVDVFSEDNIKIIKESIENARELLENLVTVEEKYAALPLEDIKAKLNSDQSQLMQKLLVRIASIENIILDTSTKMVPNKTCVQKFAEVIKTLRIGLSEICEERIIIQQVEAAGLQDIAYAKAEDFTSSKLPEQLPNVLVEQIDAVAENIEIATEEIIKDDNDLKGEEVDIANIACGIAQLTDAIKIGETEIIEKHFPEKDIVNVIYKEIACQEVDIGAGGATKEETLNESQTIEQLEKTSIEHKNVVESLDQFTSNEVLDLVHEISELTHSVELTDAVQLAKDLKESITNSTPIEKSSFGTIQIELVDKLQEALFVLQSVILEDTTSIKPCSVQRVSEIITHLQEELKTSNVLEILPVFQSDPIVGQRTIEEDSRKQLEVLLQAVTDKINLASIRDAEDTEYIKDALDEVQTIIIKLKQDYDGVANETLSETLEDLECGVRSVQLQINEDSPPELLKEACATLQLLTKNMSETQEACRPVIKIVEESNTTMLEKCSVETDKTVKLLEMASDINIQNGDLVKLTFGLQALKNAISELKVSFTDGADILIDKGIETMQILNDLEDQVFALEKDLTEVSMKPENKDMILTAIHSVYGSISNLRGTISTIQKRYMFENYGKPSQLLLRSIKNAYSIHKCVENEIQDWKMFSKCIRKFLNHFEDIKFYINFDKTARIPGDASFTKVILYDLKSNINKVLIPHASIIGQKATEKVHDLVQCIDMHLLSIESSMTLEVKKKIPIFKEMSSQLFNVIEFIKEEICKLDIVSEKNLPELVKEIMPENLSEVSASTENMAAVENQVINLKNVLSIDRDESKKKDVKIGENVEVLGGTLTVSTTNQSSKQISLVESDFEANLKQIASELISHIASQAIACVESIGEAEVLMQQCTVPIIDRVVSADTVSETQEPSVHVNETKLEPLQKDIIDTQVQYSEMNTTVYEEVQENNLEQTKPLSETIAQQEQSTEAAEFNVVEVLAQLEQTTEEYSVVIEVVLDDKIKQDNINLKMIDVAEQNLGQATVSKPEVYKTEQNKELNVVENEKHDESSMENIKQPSEDEKEIQIIIAEDPKEILQKEHQSEEDIPSNQSLEMHTDVQEITSLECLLKYAKETDVSQKLGETIPDQNQVLQIVAETVEIQSQNESENLASLDMKEDTKEWSQIDEIKPICKEDNLELATIPKDEEIQTKMLLENETEILEVKHQEDKQAVESIFDGNNDNTKDITRKEFTVTETQIKDMIDQTIIPEAMPLFKTKEEEKDTSYLQAEQKIQSELTNENAPKVVLSQKAEVLSQEEEGNMEFKYNKENETHEDDADIVSENKQENEQAERDALSPNITDEAGPSILVDKDKIDGNQTDKDDFDIFTQNENVEVVSIHHLEHLNYKPDNKEMVGDNSQIAQVEAAILSETDIDLKTETETTVLKSKENEYDVKIHGQTFDTDTNDKPEKIITYEIIQKDNALTEDNNLVEDIIIKDENKDTKCNIQEEIEKTNIPKEKSKIQDEQEKRELKVIHQTPKKEMEEPEIKGTEIKEVNPKTGEELDRNITQEKKSKENTLKTDKKKYVDEKSNINEMEADVIQCSENYKVVKKDNIEEIVNEEQKEIKDQKYKETTQSENKDSNETEAKIRIDATNVDDKYIEKELELHVFTKQEESETEPCTSKDIEVTEYKAYEQNIDHEVVKKEITEVKIKLTLDKEVSDAKTLNDVIAEKGKVVDDIRTLVGNDDENTQVSNEKEISKQSNNNENVYSQNTQEEKIVKIEEKTDQGSSLKIEKNKEAVSISQVIKDDENDSAKLNETVDESKTNKELKENSEIKTNKKTKKADETAKEQDKNTELKDKKEKKVKTGKKKAEISTKIKKEEKPEEVKRDLNKPEQIRKLDEVEDSCEKVKAKDSKDIRKTNIITKRDEDIVDLKTSKEKEKVITNIADKSKSENLEVIQPNEDLEKKCEIKEDETDRKDIKYTEEGKDSQEIKEKAEKDHTKAKHDIEQKETDTVNKIESDDRHGNIKYKETIGAEEKSGSNAIKKLPSNESKLGEDVKLAEKIEANDQNDSKIECINEKTNAKYTKGNKDEKLEDITLKKQILEERKMEAINDKNECGEQEIAKPFTKDESKIEEAETKMNTYNVETRDLQNKEIKDAFDKETKSQMTLEEITKENKEQTYLKDSMKNSKIIDFPDTKSIDIQDVALISNKTTNETERKDAEGHDASFSKKKEENKSQENKELEEVPTSEQDKQTESIIKTHSENVDSKSTKKKKVKKDKYELESKNEDIGDEIVVKSNKEKKQEVPEATTENEELILKLANINQQTDIKQDLKKSNLETEINEANVESKKNFKTDINNQNKEVEITENDEVGKNNVQLGAVTALEDTEPEKDKFYTKDTVQEVAICTEKDDTKSKKTGKQTHSEKIQEKDDHIYTKMQQTDVNATNDGQTIKNGKKKKDKVNDKTEKGNKLLDISANKETEGTDATLDKKQTDIDQTEKTLNAEKKEDIKDAVQKPEADLKLHKDKEPLTTNTEKNEHVDYNIIKGQEKEKLEASAEYNIESDKKHKKVNEEVSVQANKVGKEGECIVENKEDKIDVKNIQVVDVNVTNEIDEKESKVSIEQDEADFEANRDQSTVDRILTEEEKGIVNDKINLQKLDSKSNEALKDEENGKKSKISKKKKSVGKKAEVVDKNNRLSPVKLINKEVAIQNEKEDNEEKFKPEKDKSNFAEKEDYIDETKVKSDTKILQEKDLIVEHEVKGETKIIQFETEVSTVNEKRDTRDEKGKQKLNGKNEVVTEDTRSLIDKVEINTKTKEDQDSVEVQTKKLNADGDSKEREKLAIKAKKDKTMAKIKNKEQEDTECKKMENKEEAEQLTENIKPDTVNKKDQQETEVVLKVKEKIHEADVKKEGEDKLELENKNDVTVQTVTAIRQKEEADIKVTKDEEQTKIQKDYEIDISSTETSKKIETVDSKTKTETENFETKTIETTDNSNICRIKKGKEVMKSKTEDEGTNGKNKDSEEKFNTPRKSDKGLIKDSDNTYSVKPNDEGKEISKTKVQKDMEKTQVNSKKLSEEVVISTSIDKDNLSNKAKSKYEAKKNIEFDQKIETDTPHLKEYQYEPSLLKREERTKFIDHNHRDYSMDFSRPSGYREKLFEVEKFTKGDSKASGQSGTIHKAQTIILDSQLRSSVPPMPERSESEKKYDRHKSKALSEVRTLISEKRSGLSRDYKRKPVFSTYLTDRTAVEGSRVKLTCSVLSSMDPKITWYKNGVILDNKLKFRTKFLDGLITLEVLNAVPSDSAEYSCTVENENGSVNTSANLKVYPSFEASPIPPTFTRSIRDTYHIAENELVLECRIRGQPLPNITWFRDDKLLSNSERCQAYYLADGVCRLAINSPTSDDSGKYTCKAENSVWSDQITHIVSFTGKETQLGPNITTIDRTRFNRQALESRRPHFTNVLSDYKVAKGGTIGLQVEIRGSPSRVEWLREGLSVTEVYRNARTFVEHGLYTLALSDVTEKESGMYTCRAWSTNGNVDMNAAITVVPPTEMEGKPAIIVSRPEKDILISVGEDINISFRVQGDPKPKVIFMKGIRDITNSQRVCKMTSDDYVKFTLKRSVVSDAGTYCMLARNAYGCDRAFVTVVVRQRASSENLISDWTYPMDDTALSMADRKYKSVPERIPGEPSVVDGGNNWVSLAWPKSDPGNTAPVLAYKIESWLLGKEGGARWIELGITPLNSFDAFNLKQGEEYHFRVTPRNRYGWGESVQTSSPIGIGLAGDRPEFVDILPGQLKLLAGETANLSCSVKGKPLPEVVWMKNGHEIEDEDRMTTAFNGHDCCLTIKDIHIEDEARYSCEATNVHGRASTYSRLAVVTDRLIWEADVKLKRERSQDAIGEYPPQFTMRLRDRRVQATYPVRLTCQVVGNPPPTVTWFKDGDDIVLDSRRSKYQDEHFHTLEIAPTTLEDGGVYEAMARNSSGAVSCRCSLVVDKGIRAYVAPEFCCGLEPLYRLAEGDELRISAVVEAYPSVGVTWYRDGVRLRPSRRIIMTLDRDGQIELALASVTARDAGVYTCTASNEVGRASTSGKVEIIEGEGQKSLTERSPPIVINTPDVPYSKEPMFVRKPRSSEAREGDTVIIECEVIGDPKPDVYWLRDFLKPDYYRDATHFKRVGDGPEYRFEIPHAKLDYTGAYSVVARNMHGEAKAIISLQILAKDPDCTNDAHHIRYGRVDVIARFERELQDLLSYDGDAVEFECRVTGNPEPDIRWFHYNELIRDCADFESSFDEGAARLKIKQVTAEDEGTYICEASNSLGKAKSSACLVVYPPGEPNTLSQRLRRPPALLSAASTPRSTPRSTPARSVSRTPGPDTRRLCSPSRQMAPSFYTYPFNKVVEEGEDVTFQCAVKGQPAPWATWDKDGIIITPSARITLKEKDELLRILEIEQVSIDDVGIYRITIENEYGRAEASARLEVITQKGKFYGGVRAYSASPRKSLSYRRYPSSSRQD